ncbi:hypothetical protein PSV08DRAFT_350005 [Bipolaris maydis]|uniref:uncharacterized protein n=1 Tax=Cochliobolus heterostrophus TaxID=5016 RepID=UPI0024D56071|nr:hypothetical protein J3E73DRAFT_375421 [Bipolaris maydis]KAJ6271896.1 hypothetical protein PSV08DRAFT_350005 [Bipolaris maydis]KAJ6282012.1 hypothetical protein J3E71DRAFT_342755 [Bipolaris maydis]
MFGRQPKHQHKKERPGFLEDDLHDQPGSIPVGQSCDGRMQQRLRCFEGPDLLYPQYLIHGWQIDDENDDQEGANDAASATGSLLVGRM